MQWGKGFDPRRGIHHRETHTETYLVCPGRGGSQSIFTLGIKTALCHVFLMAGRKKKWSEWVGKTTLTEQESLTWVHGLIWESLTSKNSYSTHQTPKGCLTPKRITTIMHGNAHTLSIIWFAAAPNSRPFVPPSGIYTHTHKTHRHWMPAPCLLPSLTTYLMPDCARRHRRAAWLHY